MTAFDDMPLGTVLRNRVTDTVFIRTHHGSLGWLAVRKGRTAKRVSNLAMTAVLDLVELVEKTSAVTP